MTGRRGDEEEDGRVIGRRRNRRREGAGASSACVRVWLAGVHLLAWGGHTRVVDGQADYDYDYDYGSSCVPTAGSGSAFPADGACLRFAVNNCLLASPDGACDCSDPSVNCGQGGDWAISSWDVSAVTYMSRLFENANLFIADISSWNTASVTDMSYMFNGASSFNGDISLWDVSAVRDMVYMFRDATAFNVDISSWDVSSVTDMNSMFREASTFIADISSWDVSSVTYMHSMFYGASSFNGDISLWNTANVESMTRMFSEASSFNQDISSWNTVKVATMHSMFYGASSFNQDISSWDTTELKNTADMFREASSFNQDILSWDVSAATDMENMFHDATVWLTTFARIDGTASTDGPPTAWTFSTPCDASVAPTNGAVGDCTSALASSSTCQPTCDSGYTVSGPSSCIAGSLTAATCDPDPCFVVTAPTNGAIGDCGRSLASGSTCQPTCDSGYTVSGPSSCIAGSFTVATCDAPCDASVAPTNGAVGDCTSALAPGSTCQPTCDSGYTVSGPSSCIAGSLTAATCEAISSRDAKWSRITASTDIFGYSARSFGWEMRIFFRRGIARVVRNIDEDDVVISSVSDVIPSLRRRRSLLAPTASGSAIRIDFQVYASFAAGIAVERISTASSDGTFLAELVLAGLTNATGLSLRSIDIVDDVDAGRARALESGEIAGIVVGCFVATSAALLCARRNANRRQQRITQMVVEHQARRRAPQHAHHLKIPV